MTQSVLCAPVVYRGKTVAVLEALNKRRRSFDSEDEFIIETITDEMQSPLRRAALEVAFSGAIERATNESPDLGYVLLFSAVPDFELVSEPIVGSLDEVYSKLISNITGTVKRLLC